MRIRRLSSLSCRGLKQHMGLVAKWHPILTESRQYLQVRAYPLLRHLQFKVQDSVSTSSFSAPCCQSCTFGIRTC